MIVRTTVCVLVMMAGLARAEGEMGASVTAADASAPAAPLAAGTLRVALKAEAPVRGTWVTLGDVAELSGLDAARLDELKALQLAHAPLAGADRVMTQDQVRQRLRAMAVSERVEFDPAQESVRVTTAVKPLAGDALVRCGHEFLAGKAGRPDTQVTIEDPETPRAITIPDLPVTLRASASGGRVAGLVPVTVEAWSGEKRVARVLLSYRVRAVGQAVKVSRPLEPGAIIAESDLEEAERDLTAVPDDAILAKSAAVGLRVTRALPAGAYVRKDSVAQPLSVKRGSQVAVIAHVGQVEARALGQAKDDGANGDLITVVNLDSKRTLRARVLDPGTVEAVMP